MGLVCCTGGKFEAVAFNFGKMIDNLLSFPS